jgi:hypothetical protein
MTRKQVNTTGIDGGQAALQYLNTPDECPMCHRGVHPRLVAGTTRGLPNHPESEIRIVFQCTRTECQETFLGYYVFKGGNQEGPYYFLEDVAPATPHEVTFSKLIGEVSPDFIEIYNQAMAAESHDLDQISGIGLRKALDS